MGRKRTGAPAGIVLDAGALIALDRGDKRIIALLHRALLKAGLFECLPGWWDKPGAMAMFKLL